MILPGLALSLTSRLSSNFPAALLCFLTKNSNGYYEANTDGHDDSYGGAYGYDYDGVYDDDIRLE